VNRLDYLVLIATILAIPLYGLWRTRGSASLGQYLKGDASIRWATIGLSVLATQAGPITFLSMPGQAYESGIGFIQNYFGQPLALIIVCAVFVPIYQRLKVYTAYQYLGERFDQKTRLLGAFLFLVQRGIAAGITIYAPAIVLSALLGWRLNLTIWLAGGLVIIYTVVGGTKIVSITQRYQMIVILVGMAIAFAVAVYRLSPDLSFEGALSVAGKMGKLEAVDFSVDPHKRYTFWSGLIGGFFLALSYFGADQSQVQRYLAGGSLKESRLGLSRCNFLFFCSARLFSCFINSKSRLFISISPRTSVRWRVAMGRSYRRCKRNSMTFSCENALRFAPFPAHRRRFRQTSAMWL